MPDRTTMKAAPNTLVEGQRLDQPTFHALYEAMPPGTRAELIDGVVYMPSPLGHAHGRAHVPVIAWLSSYLENTPGVDVLDNATTILGWKSEPQPDALLRVLPECGGRSHDEEGYIHGARSWLSRFPRRHGTWTWGQRRPITSGPGCWNTSSARSNRTKSSGSVRNRVCWCHDRSETMGCTVRRCFRAFGSTRPHF